MNLSQTIKDLSRLGSVLSDYADGKISLSVMDEAVERSYAANGLFLPFMQKYAVQAIARGYLSERPLSRLLGRYDSSITKTAALDVGIIAAGNIPAVGFHDYLVAVITGASVEMKLSSKDRFLVPAMHELLCGMFPGRYRNVSFVEKPGENYDALIVTGSDDTAEYFASLYAGIPVLARHGRFSYAVLDGHESAEELENLVMDIFLYYGLGCRSVSYLKVPEGYDFSALVAASSAFGKRIAGTAGDGIFKPVAGACRHEAALMGMTGEQFVDCGYYLLREDFSEGALAAPFGTVYYSYYSSDAELSGFDETNHDRIQKKYLNFGTSQVPEADDFADGTDTILFLINIARYYDMQVQGVSAEQ